MSQYVPSQEDIDRLLDSREEQGYPRHVEDPTAAARIAEAFRPHLEEAGTEEPETPEEGAA